MIQEKEYNLLCQQLIGQWQQDKVPLNPGATDQELVAFETQLALTLPTDFRYFYTQVNGMTDGNSDKFFFNLWSLTQMIETENGIIVTHSDSNRTTEIAFGDVMIDSYRYSLVMDKTGKSFVTIQLNDQERIANNFAQFLKRYLLEPEQIYLYL